jgi:hypothetical protein
LDAGEHPAIKTRSFIPYYYAETMAVKRIKDKCRDNIYEMSDEISDSLLEKIQAGVKKSIFLKRKFKRFFDYF